MFYLSKVLAYLLLPPGLFILLGAFIFSIKRENTRVRKGSLLFLLFLIYFLSTRFISDPLLSSLENRYSRPYPAEKKACCIVILGGGSINRSEGSTPAPDAAVRLMEGYVLHRQTGLPLIFSGGNVLNGDSWPSESETAARQLLSLGMDKSKLFMETESRNTYENAQLIKEKFKPETLYLVTSAYHMPRSVAVFEDLEINVIPFPVDFKVEQTDYRILDFLPSIGSLEKSYHALHEYMGMIYYNLRY